MICFNDHRRVASKVVHTYKLRSWEVEIGRSGAQGYPEQHSEPKGRLGYVTLLSQNKRYLDKLGNSVSRQHVPPLYLVHISGRSTVIENIVINPPGSQFGIPIIIHLKINTRVHHWHPQLSSLTCMFGNGVNTSLGRRAGGTCVCSFPFYYIN